MRCKTCDYPLWGIISRECPECGSSFAPSEFEFVANSVRFCCPTCQQTYYGTDHNGHLQPRSFQCVKCGVFLHMDTMVLQPAEGVSERMTETEQMPWLHRHRDGFFRSWMRTIGMSMGRPGRLLELTPPSSSLLDAWWFMTLTMGVALFMGVSGFLLMQVLTSSWGGSPAASASSLGTFMGYLLATFAVLHAAVFAWAAISHGVLRVTGGTAFGIQRTLQSICYSCGGNVLIAVPCAGPLLGAATWIWWSVCACIAVGRAQQINGGRATLAVLIPPMLAALTGVGLLAWMFLQGVGAATAMMATMQPQMLTSVLVSHASTHNGVGPDHAAQLFSQSWAQAQWFIAEDSDTPMSAVPIGNTTLAAISSLGPAAKTREADAAAAALPDKVVAHRIGDVVFVYHGLDFNHANGDEWIFIVWRDPDHNISAPDTITVGLVHGTVAQFDAADWATSLADQNKLRASSGLPPIPDPSTVTHIAPAVAD